MKDIQRHLHLFPPRLRQSLARFPSWDDICEIRLRSDLPLSLTSFDGNLLLEETGRITADPKKALLCRNEDLRYVLCAFCKGSAYRYFDSLMEGFAVDENGWRLGLAAEKVSQSSFVPERIESLSLRIPRHIPHAADTVVKKIGEEGLFSFLVLSPPGGGKTTLLRALAMALGHGTALFEPFRVAVIDQRRELFPSALQLSTGLLDLFRNTKKHEGIEMATRLLSPQVILLDEIGSEKEAQAVISSCRGGVKMIASAHADSLAEARRIPYLSMLLDSFAFQYALILSGKGNLIEYRWEALQ